MTKTKQCGECKFHLLPGVCPKAEYKSSQDNLLACLSSDPACELFQPKYRSKSEELEMSSALEQLNEYVYRCPTDTKELLVYRDGVYEPAEPFVHFVLEKSYGDVLNRHFVDEAYAHLQRANYIERSEVNRFVNKIPLQNGLLNLNTREVEPFDSDQVFTFKLNVSYDPDAKCPSWDKFVSQVVSEDDLVLLKEIMGYCLLPGMPFHKIFWWYGKGRNGKGRIIATLEHILGYSNVCNLNLSEFKESRRFSLCQLYGKLLNVSSEPQLSECGFQTNVLKLISGEDSIFAELKGKNKRLQFKNVAKPIVLGNRFPKVEDNSLGWWDRIVVLNFPNQFIGEDNVPNIERRWLDNLEEVSGIFNFMLDGLYHLKENNGFSISKSAQETKTEFMRVSEPFNAWLNDCVVFVSDAYILHQAAFDSYIEYTEELGVETDCKKRFYQKMKDTPKVKSVRLRINGKREWIFHGVQLKKEDEQSKLSSVPFVPAVPSFCNTKSFGKSVNSKEEGIKKHGTEGTVGTAKFDLKHYFPVGQFPVCFSCHLPVSQLSELTNIDGYPIHRRCKAKIDDQKKPNTK